MKNIFLLLALCVCSYVSRADIIINNTTTCDVLFQVGVAPPASCSTANVSQSILLPTGNSHVYTDASAFPAWVSLTPKPTSAFQVKWLRVLGSTSAATCPRPSQTVGDACTGFPATISMDVYDSTCSLCGSVTITWTIVGGDIIIDIT